MSDTRDPFFIHPSEQSINRIGSCIFDGTGFGEWKRSIFISLSTKNKLGFVNGKIEKPDESDPKFEDWERCNDLIIGWLVGSVTKEVGRGIIYCKTAAEAWKRLEHRFGQLNGAQLYNLEQEIAGLVQGNLDIATYFNKIKALWDELDTVDEMPVCTCALICTCNVDQKILKKIEARRLFKLLMGLNDTYTNVRSNILMMKPLPTLDEAYSILLQDEQQREKRVVLPSPTADMSFYVSKSSPAPSTLHVDGKRASFFCTYCKRTNHTVDRCWKKHGYPPNFKGNKGRPNTSGPSSGSGSTRKFAGNAISVPSTATSTDLKEILEGFSSNQFTQLKSAIDQLQLQQKDGDPSTDVVQSTSSGPFHEEATGSW